MSTKKNGYVFLIIILSLFTSCLSANSAKEVTFFTIPTQVGTSTITNTSATEGTISVVVPSGTNVTGLIATFTTTGSSVSVGGVHQTSGVTSNDFTNPVHYIVTAADGTTKDYTVTVTVTVTSNSDATLKPSSTVKGQVVLGLGTPNASLASVVAGTVTISFAKATDISNATTFITLFDKTNTGATEKVVKYASGGSTTNFAADTAYSNAAITDQDFFIIKVTAQDTSTVLYYKIVVTVTKTAGTKVTFSADGVDFKMAYVPGGLTSPTNTYSTFLPPYEPATTATVANAYWIGETEVTYELWYKVRTWAALHGYIFANDGAEGSMATGYGTVPTLPGQPVVYISWRDAMIFSNALTEWYNAKNSTSYTYVYYTDAAYTTPIRNVDSSVSNCVTPGCEDAPYIKTSATGFRLPTINEWELAARYKGSDSSNGASEYPVGSHIYWTPGNYASGASIQALDSDGNNTPAGDAATLAVAWYLTDNTHVVKTLASNLLGLYDMSGNVYEWNFDWHPTYGAYRTYRGGSFQDSNQSSVIIGTYGYPADGISKSMVYVPPYDAEVSVGFRLSRNDL